LALFALPCGAQLINDPERIARLNAEPDSLWVAAHQERFEGLTFDDVRKLLGAKLSHISEHIDNTLPGSVYEAIPNASVPKRFDARDQWKGLIHPVRDQQRCGSCWAFSASEVLSDRVAIATGKVSPVLSAEDMVSCDAGDDGCDGGELPKAWDYLVHTGLVTDSCLPYTAGGGHAPECPTQCVDSEPFKRTKAKNSYAIVGEANMQKDLLMNGPIQVGFMVYPSFMSYHKGIYHKHINEDKPEGGHAVKIVGWGHIHKREYWMVANSWGPSWGEHGLFKILRGKNECGIEEMGPPFAGLPETSQEDDDNKQDDEKQDDEKDDDAGKKDDDGGKKDDNDDAEKDDDDFFKVDDDELIVV